MSAEPLTAEQLAAECETAIAEIRKVVLRCQAETMAIAERIATRVQGAPIAEPLKLGLLQRLNAGVDAIESEANG